MGEVNSSGMRRRPQKMPARSKRIIEDINQCTTVLENAHDILN
jgi:hypothetical protein